MILFIDTCERGQTILALITKDKVFKKSYRSKGRSAESLPRQLKSFSKAAKISLDDLTGIAVVRGPGSFMGVRTGVAWANALAWSRDLPVEGIMKDEAVDLEKLIALKLRKKVITPFYERPPNITKPKKR